MAEQLLDQHASHQRRSQDLEVARRPSASSQPGAKLSVGGGGLLIGESPRMSVVSHVSLIPPEQQIQRMPSIQQQQVPQLVAPQDVQDAGQQAQSTPPTAEHKGLNQNILDTDVGELLKVPLNPRWKEFAVEKPMKNQDYVSYEVTGYDMKGDFKVRKRYSDFFILRKVLRERWPGFYIPAIPPKKALGNMEIDFVRGRLAHLDNFVKQLSQYTFLVDSFEFSLFVRNSGQELEEQYKAMLTETPQEVKQKYMMIVPIDPVQMPREQRINCVVVLQKFQTFVAQAIRNLQGHKTEFENLRLQRDRVNKNYQTLFSKLTEYEKSAIDFYSEADNKNCVVTHPSHEEYEQVMEELPERLSNPYKKIISWIKREIYDLEGLQESIDSVKMIEKIIASTKKEVASNKEYVDDLNQKKTSLKTFWRAVTMRKQSVEECMRDIFKLESQVDGWEQVLEYVTYYIPMCIFPRFKQDRGSQYLQFMSDFAESHSEGADQNIEVWEKIAYFAQTKEQLDNNMLTLGLQQELNAEEEEENNALDESSKIKDVQPTVHERLFKVDSYRPSTSTGLLQEKTPDRITFEQSQESLGAARQRDLDESDAGVFDRPGENNFSSEEEVEDLQY